MQTYQPYYPAHMPVFQGINQQAYNPYMDRLSNLQQYQQNMQQPMPQAQMAGTSQLQPLGKMVESVDMVKATDIPMDGNMYYFPKADGTEIYGKQWLASGQTRIIAYRPVENDAEGNSMTDSGKTEIRLSDEVTGAFMQRFDDIADRIEKLERTIKPARAKKEVSDE